MDVGETRRIRDNDVRYKGLSIARTTTGEIPVRNRRPSPVATLKTGPPAARYDFRYILAPFPHVSAAQRIDARHQAGIPHHKGHQIRRVASYAEKFQVVALRKVPELRMRGQSNAVAKPLFETATKRDERLNVPP